MKLSLIFRIYAGGNRTLQEKPVSCGVGILPAPIFSSKARNRYIKFCWPIGGGANFANHAHTIATHPSKFCRRFQVVKPNFRNVAGKRAIAYSPVAFNCPSRLCKLTDDFVRKRFSARVLHLRSSFFTINPPKVRAKAQNWCKQIVASLGKRQIDRAFPRESSDRRSKLGLNYIR